MNNYEFNIYDLDAIKKLADFLPDKIFDAHMHLSNHIFAPGVSEGRHFDSTFQDYLADMHPYYGDRKIWANIITEPDKTYINNDIAIKSADNFLVNELRNNINTVGEIIVMPNETIESLSYRLAQNSRIIGFKCYHTLLDRSNTWNASINEYLPESAWELADINNLCITLHMVKERALADQDNMRYIKQMTKKYPCAKLILAHAARSFASWTLMDSIDELIPYENVFFDLSAVCESPAIFEIIKKTGTNRCMWGSDYSCCMLRGKAISLADSFYWIYSNDLDHFSGNTEFHSWLIGTENLIAVRQACQMLDLTANEINKIFYSNAFNLFFQ